MLAWRVMIDWGVIVPIAEYNHRDIWYSKLFRDVGWSARLGCHGFLPRCLALTTPQPFQSASSDSYVLVARILCCNPGMQWILFHPQGNVPGGEVAS